MKIQLASDLHLEHLVRQFPSETLIRPARQADVLVLAGDIGRLAPSRSSTRVSLTFLLRDNF